MISPQRWRQIIRGEADDWSARLWRRALAVAEPIYGYVVARKNRAFDSGRKQPTRVDAPVVSVGNLTVGGTGKTPVVVWLAKWFRQQGVAVTLLSRGYGAKAGEQNDEALEIEAQLPDVPHLQNPDRVASARQAVVTNPNQVLVLDDGFQHRRIARDLDVVLLDALDPFGGGRLLPRGMLREPVESLSRADVVALSRADAVGWNARDAVRKRVAHLAPQAVWVELAHRPACLLSEDGEEAPLSLLDGAKVAAFCGLGNPAGFYHTLEACGCEIVARREFPDHHAYPSSTLQSLDDWVRAASDAGIVICTHKDLVKIPRTKFAGKPLWALQIQAEIRVGRELLEERLQTIAERLRSSDGRPLQ